MKETLLKNVILLGLGITGKAVAKFLLTRKVNVLAIDQNLLKLTQEQEVLELKKLGLQLFLELEDQDFANKDCLIVSPGISHDHPIYQKAYARGLPIKSDIDLALQNLKNPVLAITGTNGKTTTTFLVTHVLQQCGLKAKCFGNIGKPILSEIDDLDSETILVLELSSFQIELMANSTLDSAVLLNISPDHLDRYQNLEGYALAKIKLQKFLKNSEMFFCEESCYKKFSALFTTIPKCYGYEPNNEIYTDLIYLYTTEEKEELPTTLQARRSHDLENLMAAFAVCRTQGVTMKQFIDSYQSFRKPKHRIEYILTHENVRYYDDSKGTNIDAVIRAVESLEGPIVLIAGGVHKGHSYRVWIENFEDKVIHICAIGQSSHIIYEELSESIPVSICHSLEEAVYKAREVAQNQGTVLLSPGCSSYDMFKDYVDRGETFQKIVKNLQTVQDEILLKCNNITVEKS